MGTRTAVKAFRYMGTVFSKGEQVVMDAAHEAEFEAKGFIAKMMKPKAEPKTDPVEAKSGAYKTRDMRAAGTEVPESQPVGAVTTADVKTPGKKPDGFVLSE